MGFNSGFRGLSLAGVTFTSVHYQYVWKALHVRQYEWKNMKKTLLLWIRVLTVACSLRDVLVTVRYNNTLII